MKSPKLHLAHAPLVLAAVGVFLPWFRDSSGTTAGVSEPDGRTALIAVALAAVAVGARLRLSWLPAGFAAVICVRDIDRIADSETASLSWGIWLSAGAATVAAVMLIGDLLRSAHAQQPDGVTPSRE